MSRLDKWITSATDIARSMKERGFAMVSGDKPAPVVYPEDKGQAELGRIMREMVETQGWRAFTEILNAKRMAIYAQLENCKAEELQSLQAESKLLNYVIEQPSRWIKDGKESEQRIKEAQEKES